MSDDQAGRRVVYRVVSRDVGFRKGQIRRVLCFCLAEEDTDIWTMYTEIFRDIVVW